MDRYRNYNEKGQGAAVALAVVALLIAGVIYFIATDDNNDIVRSINREEVRTGDGFELFNRDAADVDEDIDILNMSSLNIEDQQPGSSIMVESAYLEDPGYIVVYTTDVSGNMNEMVGQSTLLTAGEKSNLRVSLNRPVQDGEELTAVLYMDDGDGVLNEQQDTLLLDDYDEAISARFMISMDAEVSNEVTM